MKKILIYFVFFLSSVTVTFAFDKNPVKFLEYVLFEIKPFLIDKNDVYLEKIVTKYVDFDEIAVWIVGKSIWHDTSESDKLNFLKELKILMLNTYKKTVYYYIDSDIEFIKPKSDVSFNDHKRVQISSVMKKNNKNIVISYRLIKSVDSWLVFDIVIEGISILKSLQNQYSSIVKSKGIIYVTEEIKLSNKLDKI